MRAFLRPLGMGVGLVLCGLADHVLQSQWGMWGSEEGGPWGPLLKVPGHWLLELPWSLGLCVGPTLRELDDWTDGCVGATHGHLPGTQPCLDTSFAGPQRTQTSFVFQALAFSWFVQDRQGTWWPCSISQ